MAYSLGRIAGIKLSAKPSALVASVALWAVVAELATAALRVSLAQGIIGGLLIVLLHWVSVIAHQLGHAFMARRAGYPMRSIRLWLLLSSGLYPLDEPELPAAIHVRRALGGPLASLLVACLCGGIALWMYMAGTPYWWVVAFLFLDNLLVLALGAFLPLSFTDGGTLKKWWGRR